MNTAARPWYATNARPLLEARQRGMAPAGPVVVALIGGDFHEVAETTLYVRDDMPLERMDWRMLVNLEVWVWADGTVPLARVLQVLGDIARARPRRLCLRFDHPFEYVGSDGGAVRYETHDIDIGMGLHWTGSAPEVPPTHEFHWQPFTLQGTPIEHRLCAAARGLHAFGTIL